jgi:predicted glutamine amidotransferase
MDKCAAANPDGIGVAYGKGRVAMFAKGLKSVDSAVKMCMGGEAPYILHFRIATVGGVGGALCHPFPMSRGWDNRMGGVIHESVLFHNGHFSEWGALVREICIARNLKMPRGPMSDSRAVAWACAYLGEGLLSTLSGSWAAMDKAGCVEYYGEFQDAKDEKDESGCLYSNKSWTWSGTGFAAGRTWGQSNLPAYYQRAEYRIPAIMEEGDYERGD